MRIPLTIIYAAALSLFAPLSFSSPEYLSPPENYLWETNESQTGRFVLRLVGDGGSSVTVNYQFIGFYVGYRFGELDRLIPKKTNIKMSGVIRDVSGRTERIEEFQMRSQIYSDVPTKENSDKHSAPFEINWKYGKSPQLLSAAFSVNQGVLTLLNNYSDMDQTHSVNYTGTITTLTEREDGTCEIDKTESSGISLSFRAGEVLSDRNQEAELSGNLTSLKFPSALPEAIKTEDGYEFSYQIRHRFDRDGGSDESHCIVGDGDRFVDVNMNLDVQFLHENEFLLSPMIYETETKWMPTPGDIRFYRLHLKKTFGEIEAIQFGLDEVSEHPGVATNAGYYKHCQITPRHTDRERWETDGVISDGSEALCPDLGENSIADDWFTSVMYKSKYSVPSGFGKYKFERSYKKFDKSPIDNMPDVFFRDDDQEQITKMHTDLKYTLLDPKHYDPGKGYNYSDRVELIDQPNQVGEKTFRSWRPAHFVFVRIMDYGASARLFADVKIEGEWQRATAWGANAYGEGYGDYYGEYLLIPNDQNRDGIQDQWARDRNVNDPIEDLDVHMSVQFRGDGLTAFEEYRGLIYDKDPQRSGLDHHRTHPGIKQIFVHPYENDANLLRLLLRTSRSVFRAFASNLLDLVVLDEDEFEDEIVNYSKTTHRLGSQYSTVAMTLWQLSKIAYDERVSAFSYESWTASVVGRAQIGPPSQGNNTAILVIPNTPNSFYFLGHEIGHQLSIKHPGDRDITSKSNGWIAVKHGQHSGNVNSLMRYTNARYFCHESEEVCKEQAALGVVHWDWDPVAWGPPPQPLYFSWNGKGTGVNSNNSWAGDSLRGGDLSQLNVKSY